MTSSSDLNNEKTIDLTPVDSPSAASSSGLSLLRLILKSGLLYFTLVFTFGFMLGPIRLLWAVPHFGTRVSELVEMPLMLVTIILAARWVVRRLTIPSMRWVRLSMGLTALGFLLTAELSLVLWLHGFSITEYWATRDPVSGSVYLLMLGVFALMPSLVSQVKEIALCLDCDD